MNSVNDLKNQIFIRLGCLYDILKKKFKREVSHKTLEKHSQ